MTTFTWTVTSTRLPSSTSSCPTASSLSMRTMSTSRSSGSASAKRCLRRAVPRKRKLKSSVKRTKKPARRRRKMRSSGNRRISRRKSVNGRQNLKQMQQLQLSEPRPLSSKKQQSCRQPLRMQSTSRKCCLMASDPMMAILRTLTREARAAQSQTRITKE